MPSRWDATVGTRHKLAAAAAAVACALVAAPTAAAGNPYMPASFHETVSTYPQQLFRVIIQGRPAVSSARVSAGVDLQRRVAPAHEDGIEIAYSSINAVAAELTGLQILLLYQRKDILAITPDMPLRSVVADPPFAVEPPVVTGVAESGSTLEATPGQWSGAAPLAFAYQWQRCTAAATDCADIAGATAPAYTASPDDVGSTLVASVTASNGDGSASSVSAATAVVAAAPPPSQITPPTSIAAPLITGSAIAGETLSASDGVWGSGGLLTLARQWQRCSALGQACADIAGATGTSYVLGPDDVGFTLDIVITATDTFGSATATSTLTEPIASAPSAPPPPPLQPTPPVNTVPPSIQGVPVSGKQLDALPGEWVSTEPPTFSYLWWRCNASGGGCLLVATTPTYATTDADAGSTLHVVVTATNSDGSLMAASAPTGRVAPNSPSGFWSWQLGPYAAGVDAGWTAISNAGVTPPAIAIVDSGVDSTLPGLSGAVVQSATLTSLPQAAGSVDSYGHGSFVAEVAAGRAPGEAGAAPAAPIVSLDVMDDNGMALTSDVVAAADWISTHRKDRGIGVANFSLVGSANSTFQFDPLDHALERLWLSGVVVVTAAGNYGTGAPGTVALAPANDPFVITVGATDTAGTVATNDDFAAPWSIYGHTYDGFAKPELSAPGRFVVARVPTDSTLYRTRVDRIVAPGLMQLSGTSFAAPLVAGVAANLLALHPDWSPDQVKGALMLSAAPSSAAAPLSVGVGVLDTAAALAVTDPPNPNAALDAFVVTDPISTTPVFDTASWGTAVQANASWGTASWGTASWGTASWGTASWGTTYWSSASWGTASWGTASWGTASWGTDHAGADARPGGAYPMTWPR